MNGLPTVQDIETRENDHQPWPSEPLVLPLFPPGEVGQDCLHLQWSIDADARLQLSVRDLRSQEEQPTVILGTVR